MDRGIQQETVFSETQFIDKYFIIYLGKNNVIYFIIQNLILLLTFIPK